MLLVAVNKARTSLRDKHKTHTILNAPLTITMCSRRTLGGADADIWAPACARRIALCVSNSRGLQYWFNTRAHALYMPLGNVTLTFPTFQSSSALVCCPSFVWCFVLLVVGVASLFVVETRILWFCGFTIIALANLFNRSHFRDWVCMHHPYTLLFIFFNIHIFLRIPRLIVYFHLE